MDDLKGRRVLVTGASKGIGKAVARAFAHAGAHVAIHYSASAAEATALADELTAGGATVFLVRGDLREHGAAAAVVAEAAEKLGGLDTLVNNAGAMVRRAPFVEIDDPLMDEVFDLNVRSVIHACQAAVPHLEKSMAAPSSMSARSPAATAAARARRSTPAPSPSSTA